MTKNDSLNTIGRAGLYLTVFLTGASVMVIELLGTRLIAPFYGTSLYVWSSLISVTMIALALGYFVGGRWADRAKRIGLSLIIALAALLTLLIPWLTRPVLLATDPLGLRGLLSEQGILALNFVAFAQGGHNVALSSVARTIEQVLPHQAVFISEPGNEFNDFIFLASRQPIDLAAKALPVQEMNWLRQRVFAVDETQGVVLTDNLNPLEHLQTAKAEHYRNVVVGWFGPHLLVR